MANDAPAAGDRELMITRVLDAPRDKLFRCWTEPELLKRWFAPRPWSTPHAELDVRPGGGSFVVMRGPDGQEFPARGVYLEVVPDQRLVFTDAYSSAWVPSDKPFFTGILTFDEAGPGKTRYTATARHWTAEACEEHKKMGFDEGWTQCAIQLEEVARQL
jgi:uncharacterized protein YndB with AHSA1/START domain